MGQYYNAYIIDANGAKVIEPDAVGMGNRLVDHGFITSKMVNAVLKRILNRPKQVVWVGDYALDDESMSEERKAQIKAIMAQTNNAVFPRQLHINELKDCYGLYLINHTKQEYIDMARYVERNARVQLWSQKEADNFTITSMTTHCISPLALLTACGNGMGGGDYVGADADMVGQWAFDLIEVRYGLPCENYSEIRPKFVADWMEK